MKLLRMLGLVSIFAVSLTGLETARATASSGGYFGCWVECCEIGVSTGGFGNTVDEAWQNLSCEGHGGMCGTIECDPILD
jgi:hypothetical protein